MELTGQSIIGYHLGSKSGKVLHGFNPSTGEVLSPAFYSATDIEVDEAVRLAAESFAGFRALPGKERAAFLCNIAENLEQLEQDLKRVWEQDPLALMEKKGTPEVHGKNGRYN